MDLEGKTTVTDDSGLQRERPLFDDGASKGDADLYPRERKLTEKGLAYSIELKHKQLLQNFGTVKSLSETLNQLMADNVPITSTQKLYSQSLNEYERFLKTHDDYCKLLTDKDRDDYLRVYHEPRDVFIKNFKASVEGWFNNQTADSVAAHDSASQVGGRKSRSHISSKSSSVTSARIKEEQRQAELCTKMKAMEKRRQLELAKLDLRLQEEEYNIETELAISDAKSRVLCKYEHSEVLSNVNSLKLFDEKCVKSEQFIPASTQSKTELTTGLNPDVAPFCPTESKVNVKGDQCTKKLDTVAHNGEGAANHTDTRLANNALLGDVCDALPAANPPCHDLKVRHNLCHTVQGEAPTPPDTDNYVNHSQANCLQQQNPQNLSGMGPPNADILSQVYHSPSGPGYHHSEDVVSSVVRHLRKPNFEVRKFGGSPMEFRKFLRQFQAKVVANTDNDDEKMNFLEQFTVGEANRVVCGFSHLDASQGYPAAIAELTDRYGDTHVIANAFINKALDWPNIRPEDSKSLDEFSLFLVECENAVASIESMRVLEYPDNMKRLVGKLPYRLHDRWRGVVQSTKQRGGLTSFHDLVMFVKNESKKVNDPVYGSEALVPDSRQKSNRITKPPGSNKSRGAFATSVREQSDPQRQVNTVNGRSNAKQNSQNVKMDQRACPFCDSNSHPLEKCRSITKLPVKERYDFVKSKGLCFGCLRHGHMRKDCRITSTCESCPKRHPTILHPEGFSVDKDAQNLTPNVTTTFCSNTVTGGVKCTMAIIPVRICVKNKMQYLDTYAFFDTGSSVSFCTESIAERLGVPGKRMTLKLETMGKPFDMKTSVISGLQVGDMEGRNVVDLPNIYTKSTLPVSKEHIPTQADIDKWEHLQGIQITEMDNEIGLMIGGNVPDAYTPLEIRTGPSGSPHATKTRLGWITWNVLRENCDLATTNVVNRAEIAAIREVEELQNLDVKLRNFINLDFPERISDDRKECSVEDKQFLKLAEESIHMVNGHYCLDLPLRDRQTKMPDNKAQVHERLKSLKQKMLRNPQFKEDYVEFMDKIFEKGYAERVPTEELTRNDGHVWYIPHHGVYHRHKPGKIRVVFDCSAKFSGISLNEQLLPGPDLTNSLSGVLLRFRQENVPIMGDIEAMFFQVNVSKKDTDHLRFLWWPDGNLDENPLPYRMVVHLFGAVSSPSCSNFALRKVVREHSEEFSPVVKEAVRKSMYVDDLLASTETEQEAIELIEGTSRLCMKAGFKLTKWVTNNKTVMQTIPETERAKGPKSLDVENDEQRCERALGVYWDLESDTLGFQIRLKDQPFTRRGILSVVSSVYDPLGLVAPHILTAKCILQELCEANIGWDDKIPEKQEKVWQDWLNGLPRLTELSVRRCYKPTGFGHVVEYNLHFFSDASERGYGVSVYLQLTNEKGDKHCTLILGKSRVAPLKKTTIPRLELTAATIAVKLYKIIVSEVDYEIQRVLFWTDSMSVLRYICNENTRFHTFVSNRLAVIHDATKVDQWKYVNTNLNPADSASRGQHINAFLQNRRWIQGPDFLWKDETEWPRGAEHLTIPDNDPEVKAAVSAATDVSTETVMERFLAYFSDWTRLKRATAWILIAMDNLRECVKRRKQLETNTTGELSNKSQGVVGGKLENISLTVDLLQRAEKALIRYSQRRGFPDDYDKLSDGIRTGSLRVSSPLRKLDPFMDEDIIRVGGRLERATVAYEAKHPALLPKDSAVARLILDSIHRNIGHLGKNSILAQLRKRYWILGASPMIKGLMGKCVTCRRYQAKAIEQKMANLPSHRLIPDDPPFSRCGMDFFGPFEVKRGRTVVKRYGVLFTCLAIRAVHLEVAYSLDTSSCIHAIRRFISRRGPVKYILSDNGTNLVGAKRELREEIQKWNTGQIQRAALQQGVSWHFNPPSASHFGGVWERLIRSVRKILYSLMREQTIKLDDEGLQTLFCEVEGILNNRPLTEPPNSPLDLEVLTPNHLLLLRAGECLPPGTFEKSDTYSRRRWRQIQYLADIFWSRWLREYLPLLQQRQKWISPRHNITIGDIVLVVDSAPRNAWCLARVLEVFPDKKGFVRMVKVKTKTSILTRPVAKLCLIMEADNK